MKKFARVSLFVLVAMVLALAIGCKNDSQSDPAPDPKAKFIGTWMSPDGVITCEIEADKFTTTMDKMEPITGTWTVNGDTVTTSEVTLPQEMESGKTKFTMTMKAGESDVMDFSLGEGVYGNQVLVKKTDTKFDLTGTWKGKVGGKDPEGTIEFKVNSATLRQDSSQYTSSKITQDGNFFTIEWEKGEDSVTPPPFHGLVSTSGKAYLFDGSVFTKQ